MKMPYPNVINKHLVQTNWAQAALHNVCNGTCSHNCDRNTGKFYSKGKGKREFV